MNTEMKLDKEWKTVNFKGVGHGSTQNWQLTTPEDRVRRPEVLKTDMFKRDVFCITRIKITYAMLVNMIQKQNYIHCCMVCLTNA